MAAFCFAPARLSEIAIVLEGESNGAIIRVYGEVGHQNQARVVKSGPEA